MASSGERISIFSLPCKDSGEMLAFPFLLSCGESREVGFFSFLLPCKDVEEVPPCPFSLDCEESWANPLPSVLSIRTPSAAILSPSPSAARSTFPSPNLNNRTIPCPRYLDTTASPSTPSPFCSHCCMYISLSRQSSSLSRAGSVCACVSFDGACRMSTSILYEGMCVCEERSDEHTISVYLCVYSYVCLCICMYVHICIVYPAPVLWRHNRARCREARNQAG